MKIGERYGNIIPILNGITISKRVGSTLAEKSWYDKDSSILRVM
jgi:hypothetical protein